jgi:hypothetical protein
MENVPVHFRHLDLSIGLVPSADKVDTYMSQARDDQEPEKLTVGDISLDAVEDIFCEVNEEENIEDLLDGVFEDSKRQKKPVRLPHLSQGVAELFKCGIFLFRLHWHPLKNAKMILLYYHSFFGKCAFYTFRTTKKDPTAGIPAFGS